MGTLSALYKIIYSQTFLIEVIQVFQVWALRQAQVNTIFLKKHVLKISLTRAPFMRFSVSRGWKMAWNRSMLIKVKVQISANADMEAMVP